MTRILTCAFGIVWLLCVAAKAQERNTSGTTDAFHLKLNITHTEMPSEARRRDRPLTRNSADQMPVAVARAAKVANDSTDALLPWPDDTAQYHIPVVVHVIYDFGIATPLQVSDDAIYTLIARLNDYYNRQNDISGIIPTFQPYIGNPHVTFHLAQRDPSGQPTRGIVRTYSYHANGGDELAKIDPWPADQYLNIYFQNAMANVNTSGYTTPPLSYSANPYSQGIISAASKTSASSSNQSFMAGQLGFFFSLVRTSQNNISASCGDDMVDDTPPATIFFTGCNNDTACAKGYSKIYSAQDAYHMFKDFSAAATHKDYPDTANSQNIMDFNSCPYEMFTKGQVAKMRGAMRSNIGLRSSLKSVANLVRAGLYDSNAATFLPPPDLTPTALFSVSRNFICRGGNPANFINRSYNDTITTAIWTFNKNADIATSNAISVVAPKFGDTGWVQASLTVSGNNSPGSNTYTRNDLVYVADETGITPYPEDFNPSERRGRFPIFNYYSNPDFRWEFYNAAGRYDNTSIRFKNYDTRDKLKIQSGLDLNSAPQAPNGLFADFYTPGFSLDDPQFFNKCFLSFFTAGAFRTTKAKEMNDSLMVAYSVNCGQTWTNMGKLKSGDIGNNNYHDEPFVPTYDDWKEQSIPIPATARSSSTYFRFRYLPGTDNAGARYGGLDYGTGNNFYLDRLQITNAPLGVENGKLVRLALSVQPNPTSAGATIRLNGGDNSLAEISVADITGKLVFGTHLRRTSATVEVAIPAKNIAAKGMYIVRVVTDGTVETQKLIVY